MLHDSITRIYVFILSVLTTAFQIDSFRGAYPDFLPKMTIRSGAISQKSKK